MSAMIKAHIPVIVFGAPTEETASCPIPAADIIARANYQPLLISKIMSEEMLSQRTILLEHS